MDISKILKDYDLSNLTIGVLGGHSALDVCEGAKKLGFRTVAVCQKGRSQTYEKYYKTRQHATDGGEKGCIDEVIVVDKFSDITKPEVQKRLRELNTIFIHNRYFWVYFDDFADVEEKFEVPIYGLRQGVKLEERDQPLNQYHLLEKSKIRLPKIIREGGEVLPEDELKKRLDDHFVIGKGGPILIKANEATRSYERAFFVATTTDEYFQKSADMVEAGITTQENVNQATIEEFVVGAQINLNFFYSQIHDELELMGTDARRQTSMDGFLRLDAKTQTDLLASGYKPSMIETGHFAVTMKESLVEKAYEIGEKFVATMKKEVAPGMIGPFALQGAVAAEAGKEEFVIFDVSMRIPGSPGTRFTPYTSYLWGQELSYGERISIEISEALELGRLDEILT
jgi:5-formaminoimidazole-4-carboxamide-1-(beta)-D-ribofuranosyl 5'-monophosphate synthetase